MLRVARAGFYEWLRESVSNRAREDARLLDLIRHSYAASHGVYGARRVFGDLREVGERCGLHRVERIMRTHKIKAVRGLQNASHDRRSTFHHRAEPFAARVHRRRAQQCLGD